MTEHATPTFGIEAWDEHPTWEGDDGRSVTRATVTKRYHGELDATGVMEYVMAYAPDGSLRESIERFTRPVCSGAM